MHWLYLLTAVVMSVISIYHLFTDRFRRLSGSPSVYKSTDTRRLHTDSTMYKLSLYSCYFVILLSIFLFIEVFNNFMTATLLFIVVFLLGLNVLLTLDRVFEIQGEAVIFAGYHAKWSKIKSIQWGKKKRRGRQLIMELSKGQKIKTTIADKEQNTIEDILSDYVYFEKNGK
ncbi:hypothetical protein [Alkalicoccus halolimnae]|uniref:DUF5673 domain-containing protein n=1 Tax=Alkalicoccus halolimnae TaxID=1667239 RepID=A0A5C7FIC3_9BACI|nr:hypothetical protein [Alkalicoccus halolimnae]TXF85879.1 hypothetical protein FTX54_07315 [Alkalicoccus halolimnae]